MGSHSLVEEAKEAPRSFAHPLGTGTPSMEATVSMQAVLHRVPSVRSRSSGRDTWTIEDASSSSFVVEEAYKSPTRLSCGDDERKGRRASLGPSPSTWSVQLSQMATEERRASLNAASAPFNSERELYGGYQEPEPVRERSERRSSNLDGSHRPERRNDRRSRPTSMQGMSRDRRQTDGSSTSRDSHKKERRLSREGSQKDKRLHGRQSRNEESRSRERQPRSNETQQTHSPRHLKPKDIQSNSASPRRRKSSSNDAPHEDHIGSRTGERKIERAHESSHRRRRSSMSDIYRETSNERGKRSLDAREMENSRRRQQSRERSLKPCDTFGGNATSERQKRSTGEAAHEKEKSRRSSLTGSFSGLNSERTLGTAHTASAPVERIKGRRASIHGSGTHQCDRRGGPGA